MTIYTYNSNQIRLRGAINQVNQSPTPYQSISAWNSRSWEYKKSQLQGTSKLTKPWTSMTKYKDVMRMDKTLKPKKPANIKTETRSAT